jgi:predicted nuclease of predicted toxin-antitoxin system
MIWLDAQLSPTLAKWITVQLNIPCKSLRELNLHISQDKVVFEKAKAEKVIIITKDSDFVDLVTRFSDPPKIILLTCGNTSNQKLKEIFENKLSLALELLENNPLVEISDL